MKFLNKHNSKKGTSTVEAIIILPLLVMLTFGGLKYGLLYLRAQQVTNVARQACRLAIRAYADNTLVTDEIDRLMTALGYSDTDYSVVMPPDITLDPDTGLNSGDEVQLQLVVSTDRVNNLTLVNWLPLPPNIVVDVSMSKEGP